jgi:hypothetical protein
MIKKGKLINIWQKEQKEGIYERHAARGFPKQYFIYLFLLCPFYRKKRVVITRG